MLVILLLVFLLYFSEKSRKNTRVAEKYKKKYELDSATLIKYDERSVKIYGTLTVATVVYVKQEGDDIMVELQNLFPVTDREVKVR